MPPAKGIAITAIRQNFRYVPCKVLVVCTSNMLQTQLTSANTADIIPNVFPVGFSRPILKLIATEPKMIAIIARINLDVLCLPCNFFLLINVSYPVIRLNFMPFTFTVALSPVSFPYFNHSILTVVFPLFPVLK